MKILVLNYEYPPIGGGASPVSKDLAREFADRGHTVAVVTMKYGDMPEETNEDGVTVYRLPCVRKSKSACSPIEQLSYLIAVREFIRSHKEMQQYDICHAHFIIPTAEAAKYIKKKYGIPYIITAHGSDVEGHNNKKSVALMHRVLRGSWRKIVSNSYCVVSPSLYLKNKMENNYSSGKYLYIPNGIEYDLFAALNKKEEKSKHILVMGRIQKFKNVQFVVRAFASIKGHDEWVLDIVGDGPYRKDLEKVIKECGLTDRVNLTGRLDNKSKLLLECLKKASIYVSASEFENCPMSVIESTVAGCYPLASDISAHRQMLSEEHLFSLGDINVLADKLKKRMALGAVNFYYDMKKYDWETITTQYEKIMVEAAGSNKGKK